MSASREKKIRQELAAQGIPDIKEIRAAEARQQQRRSNILYGSIAVIFVLVTAALLVWNSNIIQRTATAVSVDGTKYSAAEVNYYYNNVMNSTLSSEYGSYMSANASLPMDQQEMTDMDLMFLGATLPEGVDKMTWHDYFMQVTKDVLVEQTALVKAAKADGFELDDEAKKELTDTMDALNEYSKQAGVTVNAYLKSMFGATMTESVFEDLLTRAVLTSRYQASKLGSYTYTEAEMQEYYTKNPNLFDVADYEYVSFRGTAPSTTDADGKTVAPTDAENAAAKAKAEAAAKDVLAKYQAGGDLEELAKEYKDIANYFHQEEASYSGGTVQEWVFDAARKAGDSDVLTSGSTYYVIVYHSRERVEYHPVNVRHILCKINETGLDSKAEDYKEKRQILLDAAKAKAEGLLDQFKAGTKTAEAFGELAGKNSDDTGSVGNGGLYTNVGKGEMVPAFDEWIYDESRQAGDTDIVFVDMEGYYTGYHVMYFDGVSEDPYWLLNARTTKLNEDFSAWMEGLQEGLTAEEHSGMKYVG